MANYYGDMGLGNLTSGLDSIVNAFQGMAQRNQLSQLGEQIKSGDLLGAADSAIKRGNLDLGLKLYQLHRQSADESGLGEKLQNILSPTPAAAPLQSGRSVAIPTAAADTTGAMAYAPAVAGGETSATNPNAYSATGITIPKTGDRAYGKYQVMGANVGPWTKEVLGTEMSPQEFLANPDAQEQVFKGKFGQYVQKYGPDGAARAWFAGEGGMNNPNATDPLGTTVASYASGFNRRLGQPPAQQAISNAMGTAPDGTPIAPAASKIFGQPPAQASTDTPDSSDDADTAKLNALIAKRNQLIGIMPQAKGTKYETMIPAAVQSLNDQITAARKPDTDPVSMVNQRTKALKQLGGDPTSDEGKAFILTGKLPPMAEKGPVAQLQQRTEVLKQIGTDPNSAEGKFYLLNGKLPENIGEMKGNELKEFTVQQEKARSIAQSVDQLKQALQLNPQAYSGSIAPSTAEFLHRNIPGGDMIVNPKRVVATTQFNNLVQNATMGMGKEMVGARVAVYEEKLIQQLKANPNMAPDERDAILRQLIASRTQALGDAQKQVEDMRAGTRFKKGGSMNSPAAKAAPVTINGYTIEPAD
jgi:uncharacterized protein YjbJ (UPF0337 family)